VDDGTSECLVRFSGHTWVAGVSQLVALCNVEACDSSDHNMRYLAKNGCRCGELARMPRSSVEPGRPPSPFRTSGTRQLSYRTTFRVYARYFRLKRDSVVWNVGIFG